MRWKSAKINEFRTWGLFLTLAGMGLMVLSSAGLILDWGTIGRSITAIGVFFGMILLLGSIAVYFYAGLLSTNAFPITCPECSKTTKMIGQTDRCMFCHTILTLDKSIATEEAAIADAELEASGDAGEPKDAAAGNAEREDRR